MRLCPPHLARLLVGITSVPCALGVVAESAATPRRFPLRAPLPGTPTGLVAAETTFSCFEASRLTPAINPGCFVTFAPPQPGDCSSKASHYLLQALRPDLEVPHRLLGFRFHSNDGATVFPAAGALLVLAGSSIPLPGPAELAALQAGPVQSSADTSWVFVDLAAAGMVLPAGGGVALLLVLRFPEGGPLLAPGNGPGIAVDAEAPDQDCDFFSIDGGETWMAPAYDPGDPLSPPLDWGFVLHLEPVLPVTAIPWGRVKALYRSP